MLTPFQFQEAAAAQVSSRAFEYSLAPAEMTVNRRKHVAPFFQELSALTGAGKTVILAKAVADMAEESPVKPVILWLSAGKVVVSQSFANLSDGGKYNHLLGGMAVSYLSEYSPTSVAESDQPLVYFATVGTFNQRDKEDGTLRIYKSEVDTMDSSVWDALQLRLDGEGNRRPLFVVYDEAQNLSDQQTELLLELDPEAFLLASATLRLPARMGDEIGYLRTAGYDDIFLITKVNTADVVAEGLIKDMVILEGYNTPMEEAVARLLMDKSEADRDVVALKLGFTPKAIYVCNTNVVADTPNQTDNARRPFAQRQAPPILIWRYLVEQMGVDPATIAVYANLKTDREYPLPEEFVLFGGGDKDYETFTAGNFQHIVFNLSLQEGWDDPAVYFAYVDKSMGSQAQITQVIGRVLRQPGTRHYSRERLNAAHFYVRVDRNEVFNQVIEEVQRELGDTEGGVSLVIAPPGKAQPCELEAKSVLTVPETALDASAAHGRATSILRSFTDYRQDRSNTQGAGSRRVLKQRVGEDGSAQGWEEYEHSAEASARWILQREIDRRYKEARSILDLADPKLDAVVGIGSPAYQAVLDLAGKVVDAYIEGVRIIQRAPNPYVVGSVLVQPAEMTTFDHAVHEGYSGMNALEARFAQEIDKTGLPWARNPARSGYGVPLVTSGPTSYFYPDFLVWTTQRVICLDTKGGHLIDETARRKLLRIVPRANTARLDIQFISEGKIRVDLSLESRDGYTRWGLGDDGRLRAAHFDEAATLIDELVDDHLNHQ